MLLLETVFAQTEVDDSAEVEGAVIPPQLAPGEDIPDAAHEEHTLGFDRTVGDLVVVARLVGHDELFLVQQRLHKGLQDIGRGGARILVDARDTDIGVEMMEDILVGRPQHGTYLVHPAAEYIVGIAVGLMADQFLRHEEREGLVDREHQGRQLETVHQRVTQPSLAADRDPRLFQRTDVAINRPETYTELIRYLTCGDDRAGLQLDQYSGYSFQAVHCVRLSD